MDIESRLTALDREIPASALSTIAVEMTVAAIRVRIPSGRPRTLHATTFHIEGAFLHAQGRWADAPHTCGSYCWPARLVLEVREAVPDAD